MAESSSVPVTDIKNEFVTCKICMAFYNNGNKSPKQLPCHHSFCCQCLVTIWDNSQEGVTCPNCRKVWPVRESIEATFCQNTIILHLMEYIELTKKAAETLCHDCPNSSMATVHCLDCQQNMCQLCSVYHNKFPSSKRHKTVDLSELHNLPTDEYFQQKQFCKIHDNMKVDLYCNSCTVAVCASCSQVDHSNHDISNLKDVYKKTKDTILSHLKTLQKSDCCKRYSSDLKGIIRELERKQKNLLRNINKTSAKIISKVRGISERLKKDVKSSIAKQKYHMIEQLEAIEKAERVKQEHLLHCQQAAQFARQEELVIMAVDLDNKTKSLIGTPDLPELEIHNINVDKTVFDNLSKVIENTAILVDKTKLIQCMDVRDASIGEKSTVVNVTLLPKTKNSDKNALLMEANIQPPDGNTDGIKQRLDTLCVLAGSLQFTPDTRGPHKTSITVNGHDQYNSRFVFHSRDKGENLERRILVRVDGHPGEDRDVMLPKLEFDGNKRKRKRCDITESGELINKSTPNPVDVPPDSLKRLGGVTARSLLPELDCALWVVDVDCLPLEAARLGYVAAEAGVCVQGHCDDEFQIAVNKHAWCFQVYSCGYHNSMCVCVVSRGTRLCDTPIGEFQPNTKLHISVGLLLDKKKSTLHVINVTTNSLIHSIPDIDTDAQLMPVFGVYCPVRFQVKLSVSSAMDLSLEPPLLMLLSTLM